MTQVLDSLSLTDEDRMRFARLRFGRRSATEWLASDPPADEVRAALVKLLDRGAPWTVFARVLGAYLGEDPTRIYCENWPRKAARLAAAARARGENPHADTLQSALVLLMHCANCGRPLNDPVSIERGIGPDCWDHIDPSWRNAINERVDSGGRS